MELPSTSPHLALACADRPAFSAPLHPPTLSSRCGCAECGPAAAVELSVEGHRLAIRGERRTKEEKKDKDYFHREVTYGRFERYIELPDGVDTNTIKATYHDGVLEVTMKAPKEAAAKTVPITVH